MLNLIRKKDGRIDSILVVTIFVTMIYYITTPAVWVTIYKELTPEHMTLKNIVTEVFCIGFGIIWTKYSDKLYKKYDAILCIEFVLTSFMLAIVWIHLDLVEYFWMDAMAYCVSTQNVIAGGRKLTIQRYKTEEERNKFSQMRSVCGSVGCLAGSFIGFLVQPLLSTEMMITIYLVASLADNICYIVIFKAQQKELAMTETEKE
jgi:hypothetical protein